MEEGGDGGQSLRGRYVVVLSGKRKSGKDYFADVLKKRLGDAACIVRLSGPLKRAYAEEHGLDYQRLLDASDFKEKYREDMIAWGEARRRHDHGFFCRRAVQEVPAACRVVIVSDARRKTDVAWFEERRDAAARGVPTVFVRIGATLAARTARGWAFTANVDDAESECSLDDYTGFDVLVENSGGDADNVDEAILDIMQRARAATNTAAL
eukprot:scpid54792/ scgid28223/ Phosphomevalonate kinase